VQSIGQFNVRDSKIVRGSDKKFSNVFGSLGIGRELLCASFELRQFGERIHDERNVSPEFVGNLVEADRRVLDDIMKYGSHKRLEVALETRNNARHGHRMLDKRLASFALLALVSSKGDGKCSVHEMFVPGSNVLTRVRFQLVCVSRHLESLTGRRPTNQLSFQVGAEISSEIGQMTMIGQQAGRQTHRRTASALSFLHQKVV